MDTYDNTAKKAFPSDKRNHFKDRTKVYAGKSDASCADDSNCCGTAKNNYSAVIMQGNTYSASDCRVFTEQLQSKCPDYGYITRYGWIAGSDVPLTNRVTADQFKNMWQYEIAYYSGHGAYGDAFTYYPIVNAIPSNSSQNYGVSSPINVAETLQVNTSNWMGTCYIYPEDPLRVIILAACFQLDSHDAKYYARIMKASSVRAVAGYHDLAPSAGDDVIARNFINYAAQGNSVWYSWQHANTGYKWAVLVYQDKFNQYYRLPGFPGNQYDTPDKETVYRYANFLADPGIVETSLDYAALCEIPLVLTTNKLENVNHRTGTWHELTSPSASVCDDDTLVKAYIVDKIGEDVSEDKICVQHYVSCEEVDPDVGALHDTEVIVERTYTYYSTFKGVKIVDSFIEASTNGSNVTALFSSKKVITSYGKSAAQCGSSPTFITVEQAIETTKALAPFHVSYEWMKVGLAYVPTNDTEHVLCYEIVSPHGFNYVDIQTGNVIKPA